MMNLVAEKVLPNTDEVKKLFVVTERDRIAELAETDEIKKLRKQYRHENEIAYDGDILSFASMLSLICDKEVYAGKEAAVYFDILDTRNFLKEKYAELPEIEAAKYRIDVEEALEEAEEELAFFESEILSK